MTYDDTEPVRAVAVRASSGVLLSVDACPYLLSRDRRVRHATGSRGHRCTAVEPVAALSGEKQRRLCLTSSHRTCSTYLAARAIVPPPPPRIDGEATAERVTRWAFGRTTPVVEATSPIVDLVERAREGSAQVALAGLLLVALVAVAIGQGGGLGGSGAVLPSPSSSLPVVDASSSAAPSATVATTPSPTPEATATPLPEATPSPLPTEGRTYTVRSGDTLWDLAIQFGTSVAAIQELNGLGTSTRLVVGQVLRIP